MNKKRLEAKQRTKLLESRIITEQALLSDLISSSIKNHLVTGKVTWLDIKSDSQSTSNGAVEIFE